MNKRLISRSIVVKLLLGSLFVFLGQSPLIAQNPWVPGSVRVGTDLYGLGRTFIGDRRERIEINGELSINKYFLSADFGIDNIDLKEETFSYSNDGYYFRVGADVNFLSNDVDNNVIFFGVRYARSYFKDQLLWNAESPYYELPVIESGNDNIKGSWLELVAGLKVKVWEELFVGYTVRFKFARSIKGEGVLTPYEMPGFGVYENENAVGFNYQIFWRFPLSNRPIVEQGAEATEE